MANSVFDNINGISIASPFKLQSKQPLDPRLVVQNHSDLNVIVSGNGAYDGMTVYVKEYKKNYKYIDGNWIEDSDNYHGISYTHSDNVNKTVNINNLISLAEGDRITVTFAYGLKALLQTSTDTVTLNINDTRAFPIKLNNTDDLKSYNSEHNIVEPYGVVSLVFHEDYIVHLFGETSDSDDDNVSYFTIDTIDYVKRSNYSNVSYFNEDGISLKKIGNPDNLDVPANDLVAAINEIGGRINENGIVVESVTKETLDIPLREIYQQLDNEQNFTLYPKRVGTWIDGTPIWKTAFIIDFDSEKFTTMLNDHLASANTITHEDILCSYIHNINNAFFIGGDVMISSSHIPSFSNCIMCESKENNGWEFPASIINELINGIGYADGRIYGWYKFVSPANNVVANADGGTSLSYDFQDINGGNASSVETYSYGTGNATE